MRSNAKTSVERKMQYRATVERIQLTISILMTGCQILPSVIILDLVFYFAGNIFEQFIQN